MLSHIVLLCCRLTYNQHYAPYEHIYIGQLPVELAPGKLNHYFKKN